MTEPSRTDLIELGDARIHRVEELSIRTPIAALTQDEALISAHRHWLVPRFLGPDGHWEFVFQSWILLIDGRVFVIDPCTGNGRPHMYPIFDRLDTPYLERFGATGIRPQDVDYVFCTHLHHDHCGWNTQLRDGRFVPTFPKARYLFVRREYERWDPRLPGHRVVDYNVGVFERSVLPVVEAGLAELVSERHRLSPGVSIEPAHGHTAGHSLLRVVSREAEACFTGDAFHHPLQLVEPKLHLPGCDDLDAAIETRRRLAARCAEREVLLIPAHFPAPHAGRVRRRDDGAISFAALGQ